MKNEYHMPELISLEDWLEENSGTVFRMWVLKPDAAIAAQARDPHPDDCDTESEFCEFVRIDQVVALPNGEFLVGVFDAQTGDGDAKMVSYYPLSRISLAWCDTDQDWGEED